MRFIVRLFLGGVLMALCVQPAAAQQLSPKRSFIFRPLPDPALFLKGTPVRDQSQRVNPAQIPPFGISSQLSGNDAKFLVKKEGFAAMSLPGVSPNLQKLVATQLAWTKIGGFNGKGKFLGARRDSLIAAVDVTAVTAVQAALDRGTIKNQEAKAALAAVLYKAAITKPELKDQIIVALKSMAKTLYKRGEGYQLIALIGAKRLMAADAGKAFHEEFTAAQRPGRDYKYMLLMFKGVLDGATTNIKLGALKTVDVMKR